MTATLKDKDKRQFGEMLDQREAMLRGEVRDAREAEQADLEGFQGVATDMVDIAQNKRMADFRHTERERDQLELTEIAEARERLANGSYGECIDCEEPIDVKRLRVEPWAARCIECQERYEHTHPASAVPTVPTGRETGLL